MRTMHVMVGYQKGSRMADPKVSAILAETGLEPRIHLISPHRPLRKKLNSVPEGSVLLVLEPWMEQAVRGRRADLRVVSATTDEDLIISIKKVAELVES